MKARNGSYLLVADDHPAICTLLMDAITTAGFKVMSANSGDQAIRIIRAQKPSLILIDDIMPGKCGLDVLKEAQSLIAGVPVIMITAYPELSDAIEARKHGLVHYIINKPFDIICLIRLPRKTAALEKRAAASMFPVFRKKSANG